MYEHEGLRDMFFIMLFGGAAMMAVLAGLYLWLRSGNAMNSEHVARPQETTMACSRSDGALHCDGRRGYRHTQQHLRVVCRGLQFAALPFLYYILCTRVKEVRSLATRQLC